MFKLTCEMDLFDFEQMVGFWGGAKDRWHSMTGDEQQYLNDWIFGYEFYSFTDVNDFIWFESDKILEDYHAENNEIEPEDIEEG